MMNTKPGFLFFYIFLVLLTCSCNEDENTISNENNNDTKLDLKITDVAIPENYNLNSVHFIDSQVGFIAGGTISFQNFEENSAVIMKSDDSGRSWDAIYTSEKGFYCTSIALIEERIFACTSTNILLLSDNMGQDWTEIRLPTDDIFFAEGIYFTDGLNGYLFGSSLTAGKLFKTTDGGLVWNEILNHDPDDKLLLKNNNLRAISTNNTDGKNNIFISGGNYDNGTILKSTNDGSWDRIDITSKTALVDIAIKGNNGYVVGNNGQTSTTEFGEVFVTNDSGNSWSILDTGYSNKLFAVDFNDEMICIAGSNRNTNLSDAEFVIVSLDNGKSWERINHDYVVAGWKDILLIDNNKFLVVGTFGRAILVEITKT